MKQPHAHMNKIQLILISFLLPLTLYSQVKQIAVRRTVQKVNLDSIELLSKNNPKKTYVVIYDKIDTTKTISTTFMGKINQLNSKNLIDKDGFNITFYYYHYDTSLKICDSNMLHFIVKTHTLAQLPYFAPSAFIITQNEDARLKIKANNRFRKYDLNENYYVCNDMKVLTEFILRKVDKPVVSTSQNNKIYDQKKPPTIPREIWHQQLSIYGNLGYIQTNFDVNADNANYGEVGLKYSLRNGKGSYSILVSIDQQHFKKDESADKHVTMFDIHVFGKKIGVMFEYELTDNLFLGIGANVGKGFFGYQGKLADNQPAPELKDFLYYENIVINLRKNISKKFGLQFGICNTVLETYYADLYKDQKSPKKDEYYAVHFGILYYLITGK